MTEPVPTPRAISTLRKRRGVVKASITRLSRSLRDLEGRAGEANTLDLAQRMVSRLENLDSEFKTHHLELIDLLEDETELAHEQEILDDHDEEMSRLTVGVQRLVVTCSTVPDKNARKVASRRIAQFRRSLNTIRVAISDISGNLLMTPVYSIIMKNNLPI